MMIYAKILQSVGLLGAVIVLGSAGCTTSESSLDPSGQSNGEQRTFDSPRAAVDALVGAARRRDRDELKAIFGPEAKRLETADIRQDDIDFQRFTGAYDSKHSLEEDDGNYLLFVGSGDWWFPAPIVGEGKQWRFDTEAGVDEILNRTIGMNELHVIDVCAAYVRAQQTYFEMDPDGDRTRAYAEKLRSDAGKRNGLYWPDEPDVSGAPISPLGPAVAAAAERGDIDLDAAGEHAYRGYYYRILTRQGAGAPGGEMNYIDSNGRMTGGFALIGWPASYGETGVMSFIVSKDGKVFQKDLGDDTDAAARKYAAFDPNGWTAAEDAP